MPVTEPRIRLQWARDNFRRAAAWRIYRGPRCVEAKEFERAGWLHLFALLAV